MKRIITVSLHVYVQSVSSQIRKNEGVDVILSHDSHYVTTDLRMTFNPYSGMHAVPNCAFARKDTVIVCKIVPMTTTEITISE